MEFDVDPFYLYPVRDELMGKLFIDREKEIELARTTLAPGFKKHKDVCAVVGGIGVGKSSFINMLDKIARDLGKKTFLTNDLDDIRTDDIMKDYDALLIDDVDKIGDEEVKRFYDLCESLLVDEGVIFFTDTHERASEVVNRRNFTVSQFIMLPRELPRDRLRFFLEERMKRCAISKEEFVFPFNEETLRIASIRSKGNLRNFMNYTKNAWKFFKGGEEERVTVENMKDGIVTVDTSFLSGKDLTDLKILWYSTVGDMNRSYLAHKCDIDSKTLDRRVDELSEFISKKRAGKDIYMQSVYCFLEDREEILERIFRNLGIRKEQL